MQVRTALIVLVTVIALVLWLAMAPTGTPGSPTGAGASEVQLTAAFKPTPVTAASTSSRGVSKTAINVVFPVVSVNSEAGRYGFAEDAEYGQQDAAIHVFVNQINQSGGINGRKINPMIVPFDPSNTASMRALCQQWTQGSPAVFAVLDGIGTWEDDNQLCITQEGHTPLISAWSTITDWTQLGSPYLWWTGADDVPVLKALVNWGLSSGRLSKGKTVGIAVTDLASDQAALNYYLLPYLKQLGVKAMVETIADDTGESAATSSDAQLAVERFKAAGITSVIPLLRADAFLPYLSNENSQKYFPKLLLSDYQSTITVALGLIPQPYEDALNGQEGITTETLGGEDDPLPESKGGYDPGVRSCYAEWHKVHPKPYKGATNPYIEEQGPIQAWCGVIRLFSLAATEAGKNLNRRSFVEAMAKIKNIPGTLSPIWSYGPNKMYGPTEYQVVEVHNNVPPSSQCVPQANGKPQGTCWVVKQKWTPLPT
jgi:Periplasmic binding protein